MTRLDAPYEAAQHVKTLMAHRGDALLALPHAAYHVAERMNTTGTTATNYLRAAIAHCYLLEVRPTPSWSVKAIIPGTSTWPSSRNVYAHPTERPGPHPLSSRRKGNRPPSDKLTFVVPQEQLDALGRHWGASAETEVAKRRRARQAEAALLDPEMCALLDRLGAALPHSTIDAAPLPREKAVLPSLTLDPADIPAFKDLLRQLTHAPGDTP